MQGPDLSAWLHALLPAAPHHLPPLYHTPSRPPPRGGRYTRLVLSITPTPGVYAALDPCTAVILHRPWALERRRLHRSNLVLASHQRLDELLTTGHNEVLMRRLGVGLGLGVGPVPGTGTSEGTGDDGSKSGEPPRTSRLHAIVGYKGDPERKMGLVGLLPEPYESRRAWRARVKREFSGLEGDMGCGGAPDDRAGAEPGGQNPSVGDAEDADAPDRPVKAIACMNAFEPDFLRQVTEAAQQLQLEDFTSSFTDPAATSAPSSPSPIQPSEILYITGEPKPLGTASALELSMPILFLGHRRAEQWAIEYLAGEARRVFEAQGIEVIVVDEPEEPRRPQVLGRGAKGGGAGAAKKQKVDQPGHGRVPEQIERSSEASEVLVAAP